MLFEYVNSSCLNSFDYSNLPTSKAAALQWSAENFESKGGIYGDRHSESVIACNFSQKIGIFNDSEKFY